MVMHGCLSQHNHFGAQLVRDSMFYFLSNTKVVRCCATFNTTTGEKLAIARNNKCSMGNPFLLKDFDC